MALLPLGFRWPGGEVGPGPAPPKHSHLLCVLVTLETGTLDSVATGFVSSHTEFWASEPKAQRAQPCTWREPLGSHRRASGVVSKTLLQACRGLGRGWSSLMQQLRHRQTDRPCFIFKENTARTWTCVKNFLCCSNFAKSFNPGDSMCNG